jgi:hypothetical protein
MSGIVSKEKEVMGGGKKRGQAIPVFELSMDSGFEVFTVVKI